MASEARRKAREAGMFWGPSVWAGLRAGDASNAEEELGVQQNTSAVSLRHTAQLDLCHCCICFICSRGLKQMEVSGVLELLLAVSLLLSLLLAQHM